MKPYMTGLPVFRQVLYHLDESFLFVASKDVRTDLERTIRLPLTAQILDQTKNTPGWIDQ